MLMKNIPYGAIESVSALKMRIKKNVFIVVGIGEESFTDEYLVDDILLEDNRFIIRGYRMTSFGIPETYMTDLYADDFIPGIHLITNFIFHDKEDAESYLHWAEKYTKS